MTAATIMGYTIFDLGSYNCTALNLVRFMNVSSVLFGRNLLLAFLNGPPLVVNAGHCPLSEDTDCDVNLNTAQPSGGLDTKEPFHPIADERKKKKQFIPTVGHIFSSFDEAKTSMDEYAKAEGFEWRIGRHEKNIRANFECKHSRKAVEALTGVTKQTKKSSEKVECPAHVNLRYKKNGSLHITLVSLTHERHKLREPELMKYAPSIRKLDSAAKADILELTRASTPVMCVLRLLRMRYPDKVFLSSDVYNYISKLKKDRKDNPTQSDAGELIALLSKKKAESDYFFDFQLDSDHRLKSVFWSSPVQILLARRFCDVLIFDNTYKTNRWNMPLAIFCIVDEFNRTRIVGVGLVSDETEESFAWVLEAFKRSCGVSPSVVFTDADVALDAAMRHVFPDTLHLWCIWHLHVNLTKNTQIVLGVEQYHQLKSEFESCRSLPTIESFKEAFQRICENQLYAPTASYLRGYLGAHTEKWAKCYQFLFFTAAIETSSRVECEHFIVKFFLDGRSALVDVFHELDQKCSDQLINCEANQYGSSRPQKCTGVFGEANSLLLESVSRFIVQSVQQEQEKSFFYSHPV